MTSKRRGRLAARLVLVCLGASVPSAGSARPTPQPPVPERSPAPEAEPPSPDDGSIEPLRASELDFDELTAFVERFLDRSRTPAAALALVEHGRIVYARGFGTDDRQPVSPEDRFYLGSCSKLFTALAVVQLADRGFLDLDRPVRDYLAAFELSDPDRSSEVTVRHLLSHTSGIATRSAFDPSAQREGRLGHLDFAAAPGTRVQYSSLNYLILGQLVEAVSGMDYADYLETFLFEPMELESTFARRVEAEAAGIVQGHAYFFGFPVPRSEPPYTELMVPAGYLVSSAHDLGRFLSVFTHEGRVGERAIVSAAAVEEMLTPGELGTALAWGAGEMYGEPIRGHAGMTPGFSARMIVLPRLGYAVALVANRNDGPFFPAYRDLIDGIVRRLAGAPTIDYAMKGHWLRLGFLSVLAWTLFSLGRSVRRWLRAGRPSSLVSAWRVWLPELAKVALSLALAWWVLWELAEITLPALVEFYPDLGALLVLGIGVAVVEAGLGVLVRGQEVSAGSSVGGALPVEDELRSN